MPLALYVYYRIDPQRAAAARARVADLFGRVDQTCGVRGRLLTKCGEPDLWMEVYEGVVDAASFESTLCAISASVRLHEVLLGGAQRTIECFQE